eukprot:3256543-Amphidinium_carterae.1
MAFLNMADMSSTREVSHDPISWLKVDSDSKTSNLLMIAPPENIPAMVFTLAVFQLHSPLLKALAELNM